MCLMFHIHVSSHPNISSKLIFKIGTWGSETSLFTSRTGDRIWPWVCLDFQGQGYSDNTGLFWNIDNLRKLGTKGFPFAGLFPYCRHREDRTLSPYGFSFISLTSVFPWVQWRKGPVLPKLIGNSDKPSIFFTWAFRSEDKKKWAGREPSYNRGSQYGTQRVSGCLGWG